MNERETAQEVSVGLRGSSTNRMLGIKKLILPVNQKNKTQDTNLGTVKL